jgi:selenocysteine-specific elongation factor
MWDRLRIYLGAREIFARFVPLEELGEVAPGGSAFCQLRFEQDVFIKKNDPFVVRRYSPMQTLGGGIVIDPAPPKRRRASVDILADLHTRMEGTPFETLDRCLRASGQVMDIKALATLAAIGEEQTMQTIKKLIDNKSVYPIGQGYLHGDILENYRSLLLEYLNQFHEKEPLLPGIPKEMLRTKAGLPLNAREYDTLLALLHAGGFCKTVENYVALTGFSPQFNDRQQQICDHILKTYLDAGFTPPSKTIFTQDKQSQAVFNALAKNKLLPLDEDTFLHINHMEAAKNMIRAHCVAHKTLTLAQFRDMAQSSRKYCLLILEYLDDRCFTKREGDNTRILYKGQ